MEWAIEARVASPLPDPTYAFDPVRSQYGSARILTELLERAAPGAERILGVTDRDLFIPMLSYVYGHAQFKGRAAVVSLARLRQEFYGLPPMRALFLARAAKEAVHEIGHTLHLTHCDDYRCAMAPSHAVEWIDLKESSLCDACRAQALQISA